MKKNIQNTINFNKKNNKNKQVFAGLAKKQKPQALFISCVDSRIVPNILTSTIAGELLVVRNVGNIIPPFSKSVAKKDCSVAAALEVALKSLKIKDIIICGHSDCYAIKTKCQKQKSIKQKDYLSHWLSYIPEILDLKEKLDFCKTLSKSDRLSQINVLAQAENLWTYPFICSFVKRQKLNVHRWWFDIAKAKIYCYDPNLKQFVLL